MTISLSLEEPMYALFQEEVLNTAERGGHHQFSVSLLGSFGKWEGCLPLAT